MYCEVSLDMCACAHTHSRHSSCFHSRVWPRRHSAGHDKWGRGVHQVQDHHQLQTLAAPVERTEASPSCQWRMPPYGQTIGHTCVFMCLEDTLTREGTFWEKVMFSAYRLDKWLLMSKNWLLRLTHIVTLHMKSSLAYCLYENSQSSRS